MFFSPDVLRPIHGSTTLYSSNPLHNHIPPEAHDPHFWYPYAPTLNPYFAAAAPNLPAFRFTTPLLTQMYHLNRHYGRLIFLVYILVLYTCIIGVVL